MTGFGSASGRVGDARVMVEVRTVNHRFFTPAIKLPGAFARWEGEVREVLRRRITRGHVALFARVEREPGASATLDEARIGQWVKTLRVVKERFVLGGEVDLATVMRMPDVLDAGEDDAGSAAQLVTIVEQALEALMLTREQEGRQLAGVLAARLDQVEQGLSRIRARAPVRLEAQRERARVRVQELAQGITVDPQRVAQELAILADRLDISEEMDRFTAHIAEFRKALRETGGEPVGKRLGFLLQEMLREANTTGSKANDAPMQHDVVAIKEELERIREQVENLE